MWSNKAASVYQGRQIWKRGYFVYDAVIQVAGRSDHGLTPHPQIFAAFIVVMLNLKTATIRTTKGFMRKENIWRLPSRVLGTAQNEFDRGCPKYLALTTVDIV